MPEVQVQILGTPYTLISDRQEEILYEVAASLDDDLKEMLVTYKDTEKIKAVVLVALNLKLTALNLKNELLQLQEMQDKMLHDFENQLDAVLLSLGN